MAEVERRDGIDVAAGGVDAPAFERQRAEKIPEAEPQKTHAGIEIKNIRSAQDARAAGPQDAVNVPDHIAATRQVFDHLRGGDQVERRVRVRQRLAVQIRHIDFYGLDLQKLVSVVARARRGPETLARQL